MTTITCTLAEFVSNLRLEAIPAEVREAGRLSILDTIGVALAGSDAPGTEAILKWCLAAGGSSQSTLIGCGTRLSSESAALFNGTAASALDYDSYDAGKGYLHTDIVVIPAALAVAEAMDADGAALLEAIVCGTEVATRIAHTIGARRGWYLTSVLGPLGAAAAASKLMHASSEQVQHALGIAYAQSAGTHQSIIEQGLTKRLHAGLAARAGVTAAGLACHGITAPSQVLEGQYGFYRMYQGGDPSSINDDLGRRFALSRKVFKKYPTCALTHAAIDAAAALKRDHCLQALDIGRVIVRITPYMDRLVGGAFRPHSNPQVAAQFSIRYCVASMLLRGKLSFDELETAAVLDRDIKRCADGIELQIDLDGEMEPAIVIVETRDGGALTSGPTAMPGTPEHPISDDDLYRKFSDCAQRGRQPVQATKLAELNERIAALERQISVRDLTALL